MRISKVVLLPQEFIESEVYTSISVEKWGRPRPAPILPQNLIIIIIIMSMATKTNATPPEWCWMSTTLPLSIIICIGSALESFILALKVSFNFLFLFSFLFFPFHNLNHCSFPFSSPYGRMFLVILLLLLCFHIIIRCFMIQCNLLAK